MKISGKSQKSHGNGAGLMLRKYKESVLEKEKALEASAVLWDDFASEGCFVAGLLQDSKSTNRLLIELYDYCIGRQVGRHKFRMDIL